MPARESLPVYSVLRGVMPPGECDRVIAESNKLPWSAARVSTSRIHTAGRRSQVAFLQGDLAARASSRFADALTEVRRNAYAFSLRGVHEPIQIARYSHQDRGCYTKHRDMGSGVAATRKLSMVILLSDPASFVGGQLAMHGFADKPWPVDLDQGDLVAFPSWEVHEVREVTGGERYSLTAWASGPAFV